MFNLIPLKNRNGQGMVEYILIVIIVVIIVFAAYKLLGKTVAEKFNTATQEVSQADK